MNVRATAIKVLTYPLYGIAIGLLALGAACTAVAMVLENGKPPKAEL